MFDNVGGWLLDLSLICLKPHARIVLCGAISGTSSSPIWALLGRRTTAEIRFVAGVDY